MAKAPAAKLGAGAANASVIKAAIARPRAVLNESTIPLPNPRSLPNLRQRSFQLGECVVEIGRGGGTMTLAVVLAKARTHNHRPLLLRRSTSRRETRIDSAVWVRPLAFARTTTETTPFARFPALAACRYPGMRPRRRPPLRPRLPNVSQSGAARRCRRR